MLSSTLCLARLPCALLTTRHLSANRCAVTKVKRTRYTRMYPTTAVLPDGSTVTIKYPAPVQLVRFPVELEAASEEERRRVLLLRRPRQTLVVQNDTGTGFDPMKYVSK
jgi:hypothetical protein